MLLQLNHYNPDHPAELERAVLEVIMRNSRAEGDGDALVHLAGEATTGAARDDQSPKRRPFPKRWRLVRQQRPGGTVIDRQRMELTGTIRVLGHRWEVDRLWVNRLVRAEVDWEANQIRCYRQRRRAPVEQPLAETFKAAFPKNHFHPI